MNRRHFLFHSSALALGGVAACARPEPVRPELTLRRSEDRGVSERSWLYSQFSFSFSKYRDPIYNRFRSLRVINEDIISPDSGFRLHPHKDAEILTYVLDGALEHKDTLGHGAVIEHGLIQQMSAGSGIQHSEFNPSKGKPVHLLQVWLLPHTRGVKPKYDQYLLADRNGPLARVASGNGLGGVSIHTDAELFSGVLRKGQRTSAEITPGRALWVQVAKGELVLNGQRLVGGDAAHAITPGRLDFKADSDTEFLLFDLA